MTYPMGTVIAKRVVTRQEPSGNKSEVHILIGQPMQRYDVDNNFQDWFCPVQLLGIEDNRVHAAFGVDSIQSLYFALVLAGQLLKASLPGRKGQITWNDVPNYGLPTPEVHLPQSVTDALRNASEGERREYKELLDLH